jgi:hypothetical protein
MRADLIQPALSPLLRKMGRAETAATATARRAVRGISYTLGGYSSQIEGGGSIDRPLERWNSDIEVVRGTIQSAIGT